MTHRQIKIENVTQKNYSTSMYIGYVDQKTRFEIVIAMKKKFDLISVDLIKFLG